MLHPLACHPVDYAVPLTNRVRTELLRSIETLTSIFPAKVIQFLVTTLDVPKPSLQVGTCVILKHLVNSTSKEISDAGMKEHLISGVLKLLSVNDLEVRAAFAQLIVAMGKASLLTMGGGRNWYCFLLSNVPLTEVKSTNGKESKRLVLEEKRFGDFTSAVARWVSVSWMRLVNAQKKLYGLCYLPCLYRRNIAALSLL